MPFKKNLLIKTIAAVLLFSMAVEESGRAASALPPVVNHVRSIESLLSNPHSFETPFSSALLRDIQKGDASKLIIHIQDAHANVSGQENLAKTLDRVMRDYGISLVLTEGSESNVSLDEIRKKADAATWKRVARSHLLQGNIQGEEYLNLTSDRPMTLWGVENQELYKQSLVQYAELRKVREEALSYLRELKSKVTKLKAKFYPASLQQYEKKGAADWLTPEFVEFITSHAADYPSLNTLAQIYRQEGSIDFRLANLELAALAEEIQKKGESVSYEAFLKTRTQDAGDKAIQSAYLEYLSGLALAKGISLEKFPQFTRYRDYLKNYNGINHEKILDEKNAAEEKFYSALLPDADSKTLRAIDRYLSLLQSAYGIQMTSGEYGLFLANEADFGTIEYQAFINRKLAEAGYGADVVAYRPVLQDGKAPLTAFYRSVDQRDEAFLENTEKVLAEKNQKAAFLITGGYHTEHLKKLFANKGYSFITLTPFVTSENNQARYEQVLLASLLEKEKQVVTANAWQADTLRVAGIESPLAGARLANLLNDAVGAQGSRLAENTPDSHGVEKQKINLISKQAKSALKEGNIPLTRYFLRKAEGVIRTNFRERPRKTSLNYLKQIVAVRAKLLKPLREFFGAYWLSMYITHFEFNWIIYGVSLGMVRAIKKAAYDNAYDDSVYWHQLSRMIYLPLVHFISPWWLGLGIVFAIWRTADNLETFYFDRILSDKASSEKIDTDSSGARLAQDVTQNDENLSKWLETIMGEFRKVLDLNQTLETAIATLGSARIENVPDLYPGSSVYYQLAKATGAEAARRKVPLNTGAGLALMEAPFLGMLEIDPAIARQGIRIILPFEQFSTQAAHVIYSFDLFLVRKFALLQNTYGAIAFPGGIGTLDELFQAWRSGLPSVAMGEAYWSILLPAFYKAWINARVMRRVSARGASPFMTDDPVAALDYILNARRIGMSQKTDGYHIHDIEQDITRALPALRNLDRAVTFVGRPVRKKDLQKAKRIAAGLSGKVPVRVASRGRLLDVIESSFSPEYQKDLQAVLYIPRSKELTSNEKRLRGNLVYVHDESLHQFLTANNSYAYVFFPGGVGTLNKLFDIVQIMQTRKGPRKPLIIVGRDFGEPILEALKKTMLNRPGWVNLISPGDENLIQVVDTPEEALRLLERALPESSGARLAMPSGLEKVDFLFKRALSETPQASYTEATYEYFKEHLTEIWETYKNPKEALKELIATARKEGKLFLLYAVLIEIAEDAVAPIIFTAAGRPDLALAMLAIHTEPVMYPLYFVLRKILKGRMKPYEYEQYFGSVRNEIKEKSSLEDRWQFGRDLSRRVRREDLLDFFESQLDAKYAEEGASSFKTIGERETAAKTLGRILKNYTGLSRSKEKKYFQVLERHVNDPDPWVRKTVLGAFGKIRDSSAIHSLIEKLSDKDPLVAASAIRSLGRLGTQSYAVHKTLISIAKDSSANIWMRIYSISTLGHLGEALRERVPEDLVNTLMETAQYKDMALSAVSLEALGRISVSDPKITNFLIEKAHGEDLNSTEIAYWGLTRRFYYGLIFPEDETISREQIKTLLLKGLSSEDSKLQDFSAAVLKEILHMPNNEINSMRKNPEAGPVSFKFYPVNTPKAAYTLQKRLLKKGIQVFRSEDFLYTRSTMPLDKNGKFVDFETHLNPERIINTFTRIKKGLTIRYPLLDRDRGKASIDVSVLVRNELVVVGLRSEIEQFKEILTTNGIYSPESGARLAIPFDKAVLIWIGAAQATPVEMSRAGEVVLKAYQENFMSAEREFNRAVESKGVFEAHEPLLNAFIHENVDRAAVKLLLERLHRPGTIRDSYFRKDSTGYRHADAHSYPIALELLKDTSERYSAQARSLFVQGILSDFQMLSVNLSPGTWQFVNQKLGLVPEAPFDATIKRLDEIRQRLDLADELSRRYSPADIDTALKTIGKSDEIVQANPVLRELRESDPPLTDTAKQEALLLDTQAFARLNQLRLKAGARLATADLGQGIIELDEKLLAYANRSASSLDILDAETFDIFQSLVSDMRRALRDYTVHRSSDTLMKKLHEIFKSSFDAFYEEPLAWEEIKQELAKFSEKFEQSKSLTGIHDAAFREKLETYKVRLEVLLGEGNQPAAFSLKGPTKEHLETLVSDLKPLGYEPRLFIRAHGGWQVQLVRWNDILNDKSYSVEKQRLIEDSISANVRYLHTYLGRVFYNARGFGSIKFFVDPLGEITVAQRPLSSRDWQAAFTVNVRYSDSGIKFEPMYALPDRRTWIPPGFAPMGYADAEIAVSRTFSLLRERFNSELGARLGAVQPVVRFPLPEWPGRPEDFENISGQNVSQGISVFLKALRLNYETFWTKEKISAESQRLALSISTLATVTYLSGSAIPAISHLVMRILWWIGLSQAPSGRTRNLATLSDRISAESSPQVKAILIDQIAKILWEHYIAYPDIRVRSVAFKILERMAEASRATSLLREIQNIRHGLYEHSKGEILSFDEDSINDVELYGGKPDPNYRVMINPFSRSWSGVAADGQGPAGNRVGARLAGEGEIWAFSIAISGVLLAALYLLQKVISYHEVSLRNQFAQDEEIFYPNLLVTKDDGSFSANYITADDFTKNFWTYYRGSEAAAKGRKFYITRILQGSDRNTYLEILGRYVQITNNAKLASVLSELMKRSDLKRRVGINESEGVFVKYLRGPIQVFVNYDRIVDLRTDLYKMKIHRPSSRAQSNIKASSGVAADGQGPAGNRVGARLARHKDIYEKRLTRLQRWNKFLESRSPRTVYAGALALIFVSLSLSPSALLTIPISLFGSYLIFFKVFDDLISAGSVARMKKKNDDRRKNEQRVDGQGARLASPAGKLLVKVVSYGQIKDKLSSESLAALKLLEGMGDQSLPWFDENNPTSGNYKKVLIALDGEKPVGAFKYESHSAQTVDRYWILVAFAATGRGVGYKLYKKGLLDMKQHGIQKAVSPAMPFGQRIYWKLKEEFPQAVILHSAMDRPQKERIDRVEVDLSQINETDLLQESPVGAPARPAGGRLGQLLRAELIGVDGRPLGAGREIIKPAPDQYLGRKFGRALTAVRVVKQEAEFLSLVEGRQEEFLEYLLSDQHYEIVNQIYGEEISLDAYLAILENISTTVFRSAWKLLEKIIQDHEILPEQAERLLAVIDKRNLAEDPLALRITDSLMSRMGHLSPRAYESLKNILKKRYLQMRAGKPNTFSDELTFGIEWEVTVLRAGDLHPEPIMELQHYLEGALREAVNGGDLKDSSGEYHWDVSLEGDGQHLEIKTPIISNNEEGWKELYRGWEVLRVAMNDWLTNQNSQMSQYRIAHGLHIHVGNKTAFTSDQLRALAFLFTAMENWWQKLSDAQMFDDNKSLPVETVLAGTLPNQHGSGIVNFDRYTGTVALNFFSPVGLGQSMNQAFALLQRKVNIGLGIVSASINRPEQFRLSRWGLIAPQQSGPMNGMADNILRHALDILFDKDVTAKKDFMELLLTSSWETIPTHEDAAAKQVDLVRDFYQEHGMEGLYRQNLVGDGWFPETDPKSDFQRGLVLPNPEELDNESAKGMVDRRLRLLHETLTDPSFVIDKQTKDLFIQYFITLLDNSLHGHQAHKNLISMASLMEVGHTHKIVAGIGSKETKVAPKGSTLKMFRLVTKDLHFLEELTSSASGKTADYLASLLLSIIGSIIVIDKGKGSTVTGAYSLPIISALAALLTKESEAADRALAYFETLLADSSVPNGIRQLALGTLVYGAVRSGHRLYVDRALEMVEGVFIARLGDPQFFALESHMIGLHVIATQAALMPVRRKIVRSLHNMAVAAGRRKDETSVRLGRRAVRALGKIALHDGQWWTFSLTVADTLSQITGDTTLQEPVRRAAIHELCDIAALHRSEAFSSGTSKQLGDKALDIVHNFIVHKAKGLEVPVRLRVSAVHRLGHLPVEFDEDGFGLHARLGYQISAWLENLTDLGNDFPKEIRLAASEALRRNARIHRKNLCSLFRLLIPSSASSEYGEAPDLKTALSWNDDEFGREIQIAKLVLQDRIDKKAITKDIHNEVSKLLNQLRIYNAAFRSGALARPAGGRLAKNKDSFPSSGQFFAGTELYMAHISWKPHFSDRNTITVDLYTEITKENPEKISQDEKGNPYAYEVFFYMPVDKWDPVQAHEQVYKMMGQFVSRMDKANINRFKAALNSLAAKMGANKKDIREFSTAPNLSAAPERSVKKLNYKTLARIKRFATELRLFLNAGKKLLSTNDIMATVGKDLKRQRLAVSEDLRTLEGMKLLAPVRERSVGELKVYKLDPSLSGGQRAKLKKMNDAQLQKFLTGRLSGARLTVAGGLIWRNKTKRAVNPRLKRVFTEARRIVTEIIVRTPLVKLVNLSEMTGKQVFIKDESKQIGGSFKIRGVYYEVYKTIQQIIKDYEEGKSGLPENLKLVTQSTGNHGIAMILAVDLIRRELPARYSDQPEIAHFVESIEPVVFTLRSLPSVKARDMFGALDEFRKSSADSSKGHIYAVFDTYEEALEARTKYVAEQGENARYMDHAGRYIMIGHGSAGFEIDEQLRQAGIGEDKKVALLIPVGAGGPIGIAAALKTVRKNVSAVMVQSNDWNAFVRTLLTGEKQKNTGKTSTMNFVFPDGIAVDGVESDAAVKAAEHYLDAAVSVDELSSFNEGGPLVFEDLQRNANSTGDEARVGGTTAIGAQALIEYGDTLPALRDADVIVLFGTEGNVPDEVTGSFVGNTTKLSTSGTRLPVISSIYKAIKFQYLWKYLLRFVTHSNYSSREAAWQLRNNFYEGRWFRKTVRKAVSQMRSEKTFPSEKALFKAFENTLHHAVQQRYHLTLPTFENQASLRSLLSITRSMDDERFFVAKYSIRLNEDKFDEAIDRVSDILRTQSVAYGARLSHEDRSRKDQLLAKLADELDERNIEEYTNADYYDYNGYELVVDRKHRGAAIARDGEALLYAFEFQSQLITKHNSYQDDNGDIHIVVFNSKDEVVTHWLIGQPDESLPYVGKHTLTNENVFRRDERYDKWGREPYVHKTVERFLEVNPDLRARKSDRADEVRWGGVIFRPRAGRNINIVVVQELYEDGGPKQKPNRRNLGIVIHDLENNLYYFERMNGEDAHTERFSDDDDEYYAEAEITGKNPNDPDETWFYKWRVTWPEGVPQVERVVSAGARPGEHPILLRSFNEFIESERKLETVSSSGLMPARSTTMSGSNHRGEPMSQDARKARLNEIVEELAKAGIIVMPKNGIVFNSFDSGYSWGIYTPSQWPKDLRLGEKMSNFKIDGPFVMTYPESIYPDFTWPDMPLWLKTNPKGDKGNIGRLARRINRKEEADSRPHGQDVVTNTIDLRVENDIPLDIPSSIWKGDERVLIRRLGFPLHMFINQLNRERMNMDEKTYSELERLAWGGVISITESLLSRGMLVRDMKPDNIVLVEVAIDREAHLIPQLHDLDEIIEYWDDAKLLKEKDLAKFIFFFLNSFVHETNDYTWHGDQRKRFREFARTQGELGIAPVIDLLDDAKWRHVYPVLQDILKAIKDSKDVTQTHEVASVDHSVFDNAAENIKEALSDPRFFNTLKAKILKRRGKKTRASYPLVHGHVKVIGPLITSDVFEQSGARLAGEDALSPQQQREIVADFIWDAATHGVLKDEPLALASMMLQGNDRAKIAAALGRPDFDKEYSGALKKVFLEFEKARYEKTLASVNKDKAQNQVESSEKSEFKPQMWEMFKAVSTHERMKRHPRPKTIGARLVSRRDFLKSATGILMGAVPKSRVMAQTPEKQVYDMKVSIDTSKVLHPANPLLLGNNIEWVNNGENIYDPATGDFNEKAIVHLKKLKITALRFPGGTFTDVYHWKDGVGPQADRKNGTHVFLGPPFNQQPSNFGTDEFLKLCELLNAKPIITVNVLTGTPEEAAEWVRYAKGRVKYWEIGNEPYLETKNQKNLTPQQFADRYVVFIKEMRKADPSIMVGVPLRNDLLGRYPAMPMQNIGWNVAVLNKIRAEVKAGNKEVMPDFAALHNAYFPMIIPGEAYKGEESFKSMLAASSEVAGDIQKTKDALRRYFPRSDIPIAITEYNSYFAAFGRPEYEYTASMGSALYTASLLVTFFKDKSIMMANFFSLLRNASFGTLTQSDSPRPPYHVLKIFSDYVGKEVISSSNKGEPTFDSPPTGYMPSKSKIPGLDTLVTRTDNDLFIILVNKTDKSIQPSLEFKGFTIGQAAAIEGVELSGELEATNEKENKIAPKPLKLNVGELPNHVLPPYSVTALKLTSGARLANDQTAGPAVKLDAAKIFGQEPHFLKAVEYFNSRVLNKSGIPEDMTWEKAVDLYEIFRGDDENPDYLTHSEREKRLSISTDPDILQLLTRVNTVLADHRDIEGVIKEASEIYELLAVDDRDSQQTLVNKPGFDTVLGSTMGDILHPASGHHRLAWFLMNFFLIRNGYEPFYFRDGKQYDRMQISHYWRKFEKEAVSQRRLQSFLKASLKPAGARLAFHIVPYETGARHQDYWYGSISEVSQQVLIRLSDLSLVTLNRLLPAFNSSTVKISKIASWKDAISQTTQYAVDAEVYEKSGQFWWYIPQKSKRYTIIYVAPLTENPNKVRGHIYVFLGEIKNTHDIWNEKIFRTKEIAGPCTLVYYEDGPETFKHLIQVLNEKSSAGARLASFKVDVVTGIPAEVFIESPQVLGAVNQVYISVLGEDIEIPWQSTGRLTNVKDAIENWARTNIEQFGKQAKAGWTAADLKSYLLKTATDALLSQESEKLTGTTQVESKPRSDLFEPVTEEIIRDLGARDQAVGRLVIQTFTDGYERHEVVFVFDDWKNTDKLRGFLNSTVFGTINGLLADNAERNQRAPIYYDRFTFRYEGIKPYKDTLRRPADVDPVNSHTISLIFSFNDVPSEFQGARLADKKDFKARQSTKTEPTRDRYFTNVDELLNTLLKTGSDINGAESAAQKRILAEAFLKRIPAIVPYEQRDEYYLPQKLSVHMRYIDARPYQQALQAVERSVPGLNRDQIATLSVIRSHSEIYWNTPTPYQDSWRATGIESHRHVEENSVEYIQSVVEPLVALLSDETKPIAIEIQISGRTQWQQPSIYEFNGNNDEKKTFIRDILLRQYEAMQNFERHNAKKVLRTPAPFDEFEYIDQGIRGYRNRFGDRVYKDDILTRYIILDFRHKGEAALSGARLGQFAVETLPIVPASTLASAYKTVISPVVVNAVPAARRFLDGSDVLPHKVLNPGEADTETLVWIAASLIQQFKNGDKKGIENPTAFQFKTSNALVTASTRDLKSGEVSFFTLVNGRPQFAAKIMLDETVFVAANERIARSKEIIVTKEAQIDIMTAFFVADRQARKELARAFDNTSGAKIDLPSTLVIHLFADWKNLSAEEAAMKAGYMKQMRAFFGEGQLRIVAHDLSGGVVNDYSDSIEDLKDTEYKSMYQGELNQSALDAAYASGAGALFVAPRRINADTFQLLPELPAFVASVLAAFGNDDQLGSYLQKYTMSAIDGEDVQLVRKVPQNATPGLYIGRGLVFQALNRLNLSALIESARLALQAIQTSA